MKLGTNSKYISPGFEVLFHLQKSVLEKIFSLCGLFDFFSSLGALKEVQYCCQYSQLYFSRLGLRGKKC